MAPKLPVNPPAVSSPDQDDENPSTEEEHSDKEQQPSGKQAVQDPETVAETESDSDSDSNSNSARPKSTAPEPPETSPPFQSSKSAGRSRKRQEDSAGLVSKVAKRRRNVGAQVEETKKKSPAAARFQRIWPEEDELALLKGMISFLQQEKGDPSRCSEEFYNLVRNSITIDVDPDKLKEKMRRLMRKFKNHASKGKGEGRKFKVTHSQELFDLSKKVWGSEGFRPLSLFGDKAKAKEDDVEEIGRVGFGSKLWYSMKEGLEKARGPKRAKMIKRLRFFHSVRNKVVDLFMRAKLEEDEEEEA